MRAFGVIVNQPVVQILLERIHVFMEVLPESNAEEFVQHRFIEVFNESIGLRRFYLCSEMFNIIEGKAKLECIMSKEVLTMQKWSYWWFCSSEDEFYTDKGKRKKFENGTMNGEEFLYHLGSQGWELVAAIPVATNNSCGLTGYIKYILKKPFE